MKSKELNPHVASELVPNDAGMICAEAEYTDACIMGVSVKTTGFCGGDSGHGGVR